MIYNPVYSINYLPQFTSITINNNAYENFLYLGRSGVTCHLEM